MKGGHEMGVDGVAFSPDGKVIATASLDWSVKLWDAGTGKAIRTLKGHTFLRPRRGVPAPTASTSSAAARTGP